MTGKIVRCVNYALRPFPAIIRQKTKEVLENITVFGVAGWRFHFVTFLFTITASLVGGIVAYILSAKGANINISVWVLVWISAIIYVLARVPISIANLGVREATLAVFLNIYGVEGPEALLMSMILFSASLFMALIGVLYQLFWAGETSSSSSLPWNKKPVKHTKNGAR